MCYNSLRIQSKPKRKDAVDSEEESTLIREKKLQ